MREREREREKIFQFVTRSSKKKKKKPEKRFLARQQISESNQIRRSKNTSINDWMLR